MLTVRLGLHEEQPLRCPRCHGWMGERSHRDPWGPCLKGPGGVVIGRAQQRPSSAVLEGFAHNRKREGSESFHRVPGRRGGGLQHGIYFVRTRRRPHTHGPSVSPLDHARRGRFLHLYPLLPGAQAHNREEVHWPCRRMRLSACVGACTAILTKQCESARGLIAMQGLCLRGREFCF